MKTLERVSIATILLIALSFGILSLAHRADIADYVYTNARVNSKQPIHQQTEAVAVKGNQVIFAGSGSEVKTYIGRGTEVINLEGQVVLDVVKKEQSFKKLKMN